MPETQYATAGGLTIAYETFGSPSDAPMLMIMGLGTQMIAWPDEMCQQIADRGFHVVRYDNRDSGRSTHLDQLPTPRRTDLLLRRREFAPARLALGAFPHLPWVPGYPRYLLSTR